MRVAVALSLAFVIAASTAAMASSGPQVTANPEHVRYGRTLTIHGSGWPVIEFCSREVRLLLQRRRTDIRIGATRTGRNGRFGLTYVPRSGKVGPGRWRLVARMRCESGKTGAPNYVRASDTVVIGRP